MLNLLLILVSAVLFGGLWGYLQGMIMIQPTDAMSVGPFADRDILGVRNHVWFGIFHRLCIYCLLVFAELVILWFSSMPWIPWTPFLLYLIFSLGCGLLGWNASELMYCYARFGLWTDYEYFNFADLVSIRLSVTGTRILSILRLSVGVLLILIAVFTKKKSPRKG